MAYFYEDNHIQVIIVRTWWHIFDTLTHGYVSFFHTTTQDIFDVTTLVEMIVHADVKQDIVLVSRTNVILIFAPCVAVTVNFTFLIVFLIMITSGNERKLCGNGKKDKLRTRLTDLSDDEYLRIRIVHWISIITIGGGTIAVVVIRLSIASPATHNGLVLAILKRGNIF